MITWINLEQLKDVNFTEINGHPALTACFDVTVKSDTLPNFWTYTKDDILLAYLSVTNRCMRILTSPHLMEIPEEILDFIKVIGINLIETSLPLPPTDWTSQKFATMAYNGDKTADVCDNYCYLQQSQHSIVDFAQTAYQCGLLDANIDYSIFATNISHRVRHGTALTTVFTVDENIAAIGAISHIGNSVGYIGCVGVLPNLRGEKLSFHILQSLVYWCEHFKISPILCCKEELVDFYNKAELVKTEYVLYQHTLI